MELGGGVGTVVVVLSAELLQKNMLVRGSRHLDQLKADDPVLKQKQPRSSKKLFSDVLAEPWV
jgi:hypothetical protein